ncbi:spore coat protein [Ureibacillus massiliensis 4400831 = CIP 108448 = CCUG 49529]|uniref:Spore coat protein n=1 Tax=Ureibacillus massiliensis 4400831 = CIP 108448 = CCUG 49529 TaxID=1211035 RepID=A0A0A3IYJ7_9BACL|nr:spore coat protein [Ureibacillus massiliensis]KGR89824.1 spore coat protein [Ureibacillus massiliensis 4400831 = CIP 108448 = CCUG 49529]RKJ37809.1 spore coat protein [Butyricicoccus sp. 1XD8-22]
MSKTEWRALDYWDGNPNNDDEDVQQEVENKVSNKQHSSEWIIVKDSEYVDINTTDTQAAVSLQLAIQAAIAAVISITIGDSDQGRAVVQDLKQFIKTKQQNSQKIIIEKSKGIEIETTDTNLTVNIQAMLQILVAIVAKLDIG